MSEKTISLTNLARYKEDSDNLYAKQNGSYENMSVGNADNLTPYGDNSGVNDTTPFVFQSSGGGSDIGSLAQLKELRGNTIKWNQLLDSFVAGTYYSIVVSHSGEDITLQGTLDNGGNYGDITLKRSSTTYAINGHKYLYKVNGTIPEGCTLLHNFGTWKTSTNTNDIVTANQDADVAIAIRLRVPDGTVLDSTFSNIQIFDLTEMFGAGNEPTSVLEFNRLFPKPYYAYDTGSLLSCKSSGYKVVGYNQFDEANAVLGQSVSTLTGTTYANANAIRCSFTKVIAGQDYTIEVFGTHSSIYYCEYDENQTFISGSGATSGTSITLSNNTHYIRFSVQGYGTTYNNDISFHLTWDESKTGYEEYKSQTYQLPNVELRSIGSIYDSITPNGTLTRRLGIVDLGTLSWNYNDSGSNPYFYSTGISSTAKVDGQSICSKYGNVKLFNADKNIFINTSNSNLIAIDNSYTDADTFKSSLNGVYLIYELETPTTEQVSTFVENTSIDDLGTQEFISNESIVVPQSCDFFYVVDYKAFIDSMGEREDINYDASKLVSQTELQTAIGQIPTQWYGTQVEYDDLGTYDSNTIYNILES